MRAHVPTLLLSIAAGLPAQTWSRFGAPLADVALPQLVTDVARHRITELDVAGDTWEWDGSAWRLMATAAGSGQLVHDPIRRRTLLLGGQPFAQRQWDGHAWQPVAPAVLPNEAGPVAFDASRGVAVMLQPSTQSVMEWDGQLWRQAGNVVPALLDAHLVYDSGRGWLLLLVRNAAGQLQTLRWDGAAWHSLGTGGPPAAGFACADDPLRGRVVAHGGLGFASDTWEWNGVQWNQVQTNGPLQRRANVLAFEPMRGQVMSFGGIPDLQRPTSDAWAWNGVTWLQVAPASEPIGRAGAALAFDSARRRLVRCGGRTDQGQTDEVWEWDGLRWHDATPPVGPGARDGAAMAFDDGTNRVLMFGGSSGAAVNADLWAWDGVAWTMQAANGPPPRFGAAMAFDWARNRLVLHGGYDAAFAVLNDTWEWDGAAWTPKPAGPFAVGVPAVMAFDPLNLVTLLAEPSTLQTWTFDGNGWMQQPAMLPSHYVAALAFDPLAGAMIAFAPIPFGPGQGTVSVWQLIGSTWTPATNQGIAALARTDRTVAAATDLGSGRVLLQTDSLLWQRSGRTATAVDFGAPCPANGYTPSLTSFGLPRIGDAGYGLDLTAAAAAPAAVGLAFTAGQVVLGSNCVWQLGPASLLFAATDAAGHATVVLPIPNVPALRGLTVRAQAAALDPAAPLGIVLTQGLTLRLGD